MGAGPPLWASPWDSDMILPGLGRPCFVRTRRKLSGSVLVSSTRTGPVPAASTSAGDGQEGPATACQPCTPASFPRAPTGPCEGQGVRGTGRPRRLLGWRGPGGRSGSDSVSSTASRGPPWAGEGAFCSLCPWTFRQPEVRASSLPHSCSRARPATCSPHMWGRAQLPPNNSFPGGAASRSRLCLEAQR